MQKETKHSLKSFLLELIVYAVIVSIYFIAVLHFLGTWLNDIFVQNKRLYAVVALILIVAQGVVLETLTTALLKFIRRRIS